MRGSTTEDDIKMQLMSMGVREFGNIVRLRSRNMSNSAFRVFIADQHIDKNVYNKACWHGNNNNNNNNCLKSNSQCIEIRVQWTVHLGSSHMHVHAVTRVHAVTPKLVICVMYLTSI